MASDWQHRRLGDFLQEVSRASGVDPGHRYSLLGCRWYGRGCHVHDVVDGAKLKTKVLNEVREGDITYNKMWVRKGAFAVVTRSHLGLHATTEYPTFEVDTAFANPDFIGRVICSPAFVAAASERCRGTTSRARLNPRDFLDLPVHLPPLAEQRKIAAILSSVDETIEKTEAVIAQLEALQASLLHDEIDRALAGAPPCSIGDLAELGNGRGFSPEEWSDQGLPIIRIQNLNGRREFNHYAGVAKDEWLVHPGDLLFAWAGSRGASFGPCIWRGPVGVLNQHIYRVLPSAGVDRDFLYWLLVFVTRQVEQRAHGFKQTLVHLKKGDLTSWPAGLPTQAVQQLLAERLGSVAQRIEAERQVLAATQQLKASLSDGLLSGGVLASCEVVAP